MTGFAVYLHGNGRYPRIVKALDITEQGTFVTLELPGCDCGCENDGPIDFVISGEVFLASYFAKAFYYADEPLHAPSPENGIIAQVLDDAYNLPFECSGEEMLAAAIMRTLELIDADEL